jgi:hypothetical protein
MEERLVQVVARLLKISEAKAGLLMYSIINFNVWLHIIDNLFIIDGAYPESLKLWRRIRNRLNAEKDVRDRLAHHGLSQVREIHRHVRGERIIVERGIQAYLRPPKADVRNKSKKMAPLTMVEIIEFTGRVSNVHDALIVLLHQMKKSKSLR